MTETTTVQPLTSERLKKAVAEDVAVRFSAQLQPVGGRGDKVFPPTYAGGQYALESRVDEHGVVKEVVLLDSVQSQANRMEQALLAAHRAERITLPMISVSFSKIEQLKELGDITVLDAPHRLADAILRDSMLNRVLFPATPEGGLREYFVAQHPQIKRLIGEYWQLTPRTKQQKKRGGMPGRMTDVD